ncbi:FkbM family methyltransferase [Oceanirhabdus sp. W0125-5]|uniref:FkbM family methyltransferase n=1 Tax=Oceanirhabdus sp. W0125-5 TaxID=2999116 RepID=UPI0022F30870|nr:FkbM family methyltransferase [Oceanirhabdus sp. W0125-5]WBW96620.1 FkbM family methyltransferase [Oceanirhabdus sp. W0125-5]
MNNFIIFGGDIPAISAFILLNKRQKRVLAFINKSNKIIRDTFSDNYSIYENEDDIPLDIINKVNKILVVNDDRNIAKKIKDNLICKLNKKILIETIYDSNYITDYLNIKLDIHSTLLNHPQDNLNENKIKKEIVRVNVNEISFEICCNNLNEYLRATTLIGESEVLSFLKKKIRPNDVFYDIGANIGTHSIFIAKCYDTVKVHSFEPEIKNYNDLLQNINYNKLTNITTHKIALGDERKNQNLYLYSENAGEGGNSIVPIKGKKTQLIDVWDLDSYRIHNKIDLPNLIKIDIEGYELQALIGMMKTLQQSKPKLLIELHPKKLLQQFGDINIVKDFLITQNYKVTDLTILERKGQLFIYAIPKF